MIAHSHYEPAAKSPNSIGEDRAAIYPIALNEQEDSHKQARFKGS
jgi:hypothetical protein